MTFHLLYVCTGNICRSPMAEAMTRHALRPEHSGITTGSAGVSALEDFPISNGSAAALDRLGIPYAGHRGRMLTEEMVDGADLILTMEAAHRSMIVSHQPAASTRTFTLREFARLVDGQSVTDATGVADRCRRVVELAAERRAVSPPGIEDVPDPYGGPLEGYHTCAALLRTQLATALHPLLGVWG